MGEILLGVLAVVAVVLWLLVKKMWEVMSEIVADLWNDMTGETARKKIREENARKEEEERQQRQRERQQKRLQAEIAKRQHFRAENRGVFTGIRHLLSTCAPPAVEIMRAAGAIEGEDFERDPKLVVWTDIGFILASFNRTDSAGNAYIETLWEEVTRTIRPPDVDGVPPLSVFENHGVKQLGMVSLLANYDKLQGTTLSSKAASTYLSIVPAVSNHCDGSLAAKIVADTYIELLSPYIHDSGGNRYAGNSSSSAGGNSNRKSVCEKCNKAFKLLDLPLGASDKEVKSKKRAFAELLHDDRLGAMSDSARRIAQEQHKNVNEACDHILTCRVRSGRS